MGRKRDGTTAKAPRKPRRRASASSAPKEKKRKRSASTDAGLDRDEFSRTAGRQVRTRLDINVALPEYEAPPKIREGVLDAFLVAGVLDEDDAINRRYRAFGKGMDETYSTAATRELVKGILGDDEKSSFSKEEWAYLRGLIDIFSSARIPTEYSGYALKDSMMQHPASRDKALFTDPYDTASEHAHLDIRRRAYVRQATSAAIKAGKDARGIVISSAQAAIEFTLNQFTAPITADNVLPFTRRKGTAVTDAVNLKQEESRERLKRIYKDLGGKLRPAEKAESDEQALRRAWDRSDVERPPSPLRTGVRDAPQHLDPFGGGMDIGSPGGMPSLGDAKPGMESDAMSVVSEAASEEAASAASDLILLI